MTTPREIETLSGFTLRQDSSGGWWYLTLFFRWNRWPKGNREQLTWDEVEREAKPRIPESLASS